MKPLLGRGRGWTLALLIGNGFGQALSAVVASLAVEQAFRRLGSSSSTQEITLIGVVRSASPS